MKLWDGHKTAHGLRRRSGMGNARVARRLAVVVRTDHQAKAGKLAAQCPRHGHQVAAIEGNSHRLPCGLVQGACRCQTFTQQQGTHRLADSEVAAHDAAAREEPF